MGLVKEFPTALSTGDTNRPSHHIQFAPALYRFFLFSATYVASNSNYARTAPPLLANKRARPRLAICMRQQVSFASRTTREPHLPRTSRLRTHTPEPHCHKYTRTGQTSALGYATAFSSLDGSAPFSLPSPRRGSLCRTNSLISLTPPFSPPQGNSSATTPAQGRRLPVVAEMLDNTGDAHELLFLSVKAARARATRHPGNP